MVSWKEHLKNTWNQLRKDNPKALYKEAMKAAGKTYKKTKSVVTDVEEGIEQVFVGKKKTRSHKRRSHKSKSHKSKSHKSKSHKSKSHKRRSHKRKSHKRKSRGGR
jgi:hypothetical protein